MDNRSREPRVHIAGIAKHLATKPVPEIDNPSAFLSLVVSERGRALHPARRLDGAHPRHGMKGVG